MIQEPADLSVAPSTLESAVMSGGFRVKTVAFSNAGPGSLHFQVTSPENWITATPAEGVIAPGNSLDVSARMEASGLPDGDAVGTIHVLSNDPATPDLSLPVVFHIGTTAPAAFAIGPESLNPNSKGNWVTANLELSSELSPNDVLLESVRALGTVPIGVGGAVLGDFNQNGVPDWTFKFDRSAFVLALPPEDSVNVQVTGEVRDRTWFLLQQPIRVLRPHLLSPNGGEKWLAGSWKTLTWNLPPRWEPRYVSLFYSANAGSTWDEIAARVDGTSFPWRVPEAASDSALIMIQAFDDLGVIGSDVSDRSFALVTATTGVGDEPLASIPTLRQNTPNPFRDMTTIEFALPAEAAIDLKIFDLSGRSLRRLAGGVFPAGTHRTIWDGRDSEGRRISSGFYILRLEVGGNRFSRRVLLLP